MYCKNGNKISAVKSEKPKLLEICNSTEKTLEKVELVENS